MSNTNIREKKQIKPEATEKLKQIWLGEYTDITFEKHIITPRKLEEFFKSAIDQAMNDENTLVIADIYLGQKIPGKVYMDWVLRYKIGREAHAIIKECIARRREKGALNRALEAKTATRMLPIYSKEWKEAEEWRASLGNKEDAQSGNITVIMPSLTSEQDTSSDTPEGQAEPSIKRQCFDEFEGEAIDHNEVQGVPENYEESEMTTGATKIKKVKAYEDSYKVKNKKKRRMPEPKTYNTPEELAESIRKTTAAKHVCRTRTK